MPSLFCIAGDLFEQTNLCRFSSFYNRQTDYSIVTLCALKKQKEQQEEKVASLHHFHFILLLLQGSRVFRQHIFSFLSIPLWNNCLVPDEKWGFLFCTGVWGLGNEQKPTPNISPSPSLLFPSHTIVVALNCSDMGQAVVHLLSSSSQNRISKGTDRRTASHYYIFLLGIQKRNCGVPKVTYLLDKLPNIFTY